MAKLAGVVLLSGMYRRILIPVIAPVVVGEPPYWIVVDVPGGKGSRYKMSMDTYQIN